MPSLEKYPNASGPIPVLKIIPFNVEHEIMFDGTDLRSALVRVPASLIKVQTDLVDGVVVH